MPLLLFVLQKEASEPQYPGDPASLVTFDIFRAGTDGIVNLRWGLEASAVSDIMTPLTGIMTFSAVIFFYFLVYIIDCI